ncbi:MAG: cell division protein FtsZ [Candidatus Cloacimonetes bacterium]|nr:cell division protein FtsZ [Candidatus Cloacimonadota bacterium]
MIEFDEKPSIIGTNIKVIGIGGAGGNAVNAMIKNELTGVEFIAANTDIKDLHKSRAKMKLQLGKRLTRGLGCGALPEKGRLAAEESKDEIKSHLEGADMVFVTAGMGGGTGTGGAPIVAKIAKDLGILTLGIVSLPFHTEGKKRSENAEEGIRNLSENVDTLIVIPNEKLKEIYSDLSILNAFRMADNVLYDAAKAISDIINISGYISVDFADVQTVMQNMGYALMGTGTAEGENRSVLAARSAIKNPLLSDIDLQGCQSMLINVTGGMDMTLAEFEEVAQVIINETGTTANIIQGLVIDENISGKISVTLIATGLKRKDGVEMITQPTSAPPPFLPESNDLEDIQNIFKNIDMSHSAATEKTALTKPTKDAKEIPGQSTIFNFNQTDVPSFLKALD